MANYDQELLDAAKRLLHRSVGPRGRLPGARIRRSVSTTYYALFHFLSEEVGTRVAGTGADVRIRRRILARTVTHKGMKIALVKVQGSAIDPSVSAFLAGSALPPMFASNLARAFLDAQAKREDADYDLNKQLSEADARLLRLRVKRVIAAWRGARTRSDRDFKHALCMLILLKGQLRND